MDDEGQIAGSSSSYEPNNRKRVFSAEDEDDEVLREIDVIVSNKLAKSLYLLQYPLTPAAAKLPPKQHRTVQFKPKQCKLQIKCEIDTNSRNYDKNRGEQLALNCAPGDKNKEPIFKKVMDHQIYTNENVAGLHTNCYAIGLYINGALHLNPLHEILQMKPTFNYLDAADEKSRSQKTGTNDGGETSGDEFAAEPALQAVRVKFAAANMEESEAAKKRKNASFAYKQKLMDDEKWIPLRYGPSENQNAEELRAMLTYEKPEGVDQSTQKPLLFSNDPSSLMRLFIPEAEQEEGGLPETPSDTISLSQLRTLPLPDQVQALMTNVKVMQYDKLIPLLPPGSDTDVVLKSLQNCACLVQGCWIVKSELLYPRHMKSPKSGLSGEYLCRVRDLVLYKFRQNPYLDKKEITNCVKVNNEDLTDILKPISKFKQQKGYQFLFDCDEDFLKKFSEVVQRQCAFWEAKYQTLCHHLNLRQRVKSGQQQPGNRVARRTFSSRSGSEMFSGGEDEKSSTIPAVSKSQAPVVASPHTATKSPAPQSPAKTSSSSPVRQRPSSNSPSKKRSQNGAVASSSNAGDDLKKEFRKFLYEKLSDKPCLPLSEIKRLLILRLAESPPGHVLSQGGISDKLIDQCAEEMGAVKIENSKLKEPIYAYTEVGTWPEARRVLIKLFTSDSKKTSVYFKTFKNACLDARLEPLPSDDDLRNILNVIMAEQQMQQPKSGAPATLAESAERAMNDILAVRHRERESWDAFWKLTKLEAGDNLFKLSRYYVWRLLDIVPTWVRENIVEPLHDKYRWPYYHYKFPRVPSIDECKVGDEACRYEANFQYMLDRLVDSNILLILRENLDRCEKYYNDDYRRCLDARDELEENELNHFIKYGELTVTSDVLEAYMKQKHRLIWERRHPRVMELRAKAYEKYKESLAKGVYDEFFYKRGTIFSYRRHQAGWSKNLQQREPSLTRDDISQDPHRLKEEQDLAAENKMAYRMDEYKFWEHFP